MYRTSHSIRILSAALAAVFGLGLVATAGGALHEKQARTKAEPSQVIHMEPVIIRLHQPSQLAVPTVQEAKAAL
ncbi:MAG TPA: hypothetical protein VM937_04690 [Burkholderiaceae bacterium]|jgi:hypothetical protein|nr:hypothetical protein [Burkholderiaceae bacterium]